MPAVEPSVFHHPTLLGKTVFILGAGFSKPLGLPLIADFIPEGLNLLKRHAWDDQCPWDSDSRKEDGQLVADLQNVLGSRLTMLRALGSGEPTIEDVFCAVDLLGEAGDGESKKPARPLLEKFVRRVCRLGMARHGEALKNFDSGLVDQPFAPQVSHVHFKSQPVRKGSSGLHALQFDPEKGQRPGQQVCAYSAFLSQIAESCAHIHKPVEKEIERYAHPAILSLNYDLVIETKLDAFAYAPLKAWYGSGVVNEDETFKDREAEAAFPWLVREKNSSGAIASLMLSLLKLHGSVNWVSGLSKSAVARTPEKVIVRPQEDGAEREEAPLILPTWQRDPLASTVFDKVLREARIHLRLASRIVIIGYSLPPTDRYLRYLLADAFDTPEQPALEICNGWDEPRCRERVRRMIGARAAEGEMRVCPGGFLEYVAAQRQSELLA